MRATVRVGSLAIDRVLYDFVNDDALPGTGVEERAFWSGFASLVEAMEPRNTVLLRRRMNAGENRRLAPPESGRRVRPGPLQIVSDRNRLFDPRRGSILDRHRQGRSRDRPDRRAATGGTGQQRTLCPECSQRALGSLYDALYGSDVIPEDGAARSGPYDPQRGAKVIAYARDFLDRCFSLAEGSHRDALSYRVTAQGLDVQLKDGKTTGLTHPGACRGFQGEADSPTMLLLVHHGLHLEVHIDRSHYIGRDDDAGISDVVLESAITTIQDCEDSVAAVDADEKVQVYRNWLGLMKGTLEARIAKGASRTCAA